MNAFTTLLVRDMRLATRVGGGALMGALFFVIVVVMMPFAIGPDLGSVRCSQACLRLTGCLRLTMRTDRSIS